ncbi:hypothetical protein EV126DRAFT_243985 [Verticillium dahliae]|nr:hypothetical protein EV126DRAFT_243985 [Verticillium dahliae]
MIRFGGSAHTIVLVAVVFPFHMSSDICVCLVLESLHYVLLRLAAGFNSTTTAPSPRHLEPPSPYIPTPSSKDQEHT